MAVLAETCDPAAKTGTTSAEENRSETAKRTLGPAAGLRGVEECAFERDDPVRRLVFAAEDGASGVRPAAGVGARRAVHS